MGARTYRRKTAWITYEPGVLSVSSAGLLVSDMTNDWEAAGGNLLGNRIERIHLEIGQVFGAVSDVFRYGVLVGRIADVGSTTHPDPGAVNDRDLKWMLNTRVFGTNTAAGVDGAKQFSFDLRARRNMTQFDERLILCIGSSSATAHNVTPYARVLVSLP